MAPRKYFLRIRDNPDPTSLCPVSRCPSIPAMTGSTEDVMNRAANPIFRDAWFGSPSAGAAAVAVAVRFPYRFVSALLGFLARAPAGELRQDALGGQGGGDLARADPGLKARGALAHARMRQQAVHQAVAHLLPHPVHLLAAAALGELAGLLKGAAMVADRLPEVVQPLTGKAAARQHGRTPGRVHRLGRASCRERE